VSRLPQVLQVSIHGVRLEEQSIKELSRLRRIDQLALFNTDVSDELAARLATALPNTKVDVRRGGKLGVGGQPLLVPCVITQVQMGSAADKAGIQVGDVIRSFDGQKVESFEDLTNKIGAHGPGDEVAVGVERGGTVFEKTLALDGWQ
jgi:S1-C subfamily serine protease